jgi:hypothetical protein
MICFPDYNIFFILFKCYFFDYFNRIINVIYNHIQINIMEIKEETSVRYQGKISLITTIPKTYVKALNIKSGDTLEWILDTETETLELKVVK